jgi:hypothetical protein
VALQSKKKNSCSVCNKLYPNFWQEIFWPMKRRRQIMQRTFAFGFAVLLALGSSTAFAQTVIGTSAGCGWTGYGGRLGYYSSTAAEGYLRGKAAVAQAAVSYNLDTAQAWISAEQARALAIENDRLAIQEYFQRQEINRQYRASARGPRPTMEDISRRAREAAPDRLDRYQLDPVFGTITWPATLQAPQFALYREEVEHSFRDRDIMNSGLGSKVQRTVAYSTEVMEQKLKGMIDVISPAEYVQAKRFLQSLEYEAEQAPQIQGVAAISP